MRVVDEAAGVVRLGITAYAQEQLGDIVYRFARRLADAPTMPTWNADAEFRRTTSTQP